MIIEMIIETVTEYSIYFKMKIKISMNGNNFISIKHFSISLFCLKNIVAKRSTLCLERIY